MTLFRRTVLAGLFVSGLNACAVGTPARARRITLSTSEVERLLARQFPLERRLLDWFDVTLASPQLRLLPERSRMAAVVDISARERLLRGVWQGRLSFDAALRWSAADRTVRLSQVRVQDLALDDPASATRSTVERLGAAAAERVLEDVVVYRLPDAQARAMADLGLRPGGLEITQHGIEITLQPLIAPTVVPSAAPAVK